MKKNIIICALALTSLGLSAFAFRSEKPSVKTDKTAYQELKTYSISLNVKDIKTSYEFYQKLGFETMIGGGLEQGWIIVENGHCKLGLFQGLFPKNTITFNPENGRQVLETLKSNGIEPSFTMGFDKEEGPCTISIVDPDGNPILIDQH